MTRSPVAKPRPRCGAHKVDGSPCPNWPMHNQETCHAHGGRAPQNRRAASLRLLEEQVRELFGAVLPAAVPVTNPLAAYAQFAGEVMAWKELMRSLLEDLATVGYRHEKAGEQIHAAVQLYERAMDRANRVLADYARLKIDERLAVITEAQKLAVILAIGAALDEAGLDGEARDEATRAAARHLRTVGADNAAGRGARRP